MLYGLFTNSNDEIKGKVQIVNGDKLPTKDGCSLELVSKGQYNNAVIIEPPIYQEDDLVNWGFNTFPQFIGTAHEYILTKFAEDPSKWKTFMLARALIIDSSEGGTTFTDIANALIAKATELGADLS